jgi:hypothetical protein
MFRVACLFLLLTGSAEAICQRYVKINETRVLTDHRAINDPGAIGNPDWHFVTVSEAEEAACHAILGDEIEWNRILHIATLDLDNKLVIPADFVARKTLWLNAREVLDLQSQAVDLTVRITAATTAGYTALAAALTSDKAVVEARIVALTP